MLSDIEIANAAELNPILQVAQDELGIELPVARRAVQYRELLSPQRRAVDDGLAVVLDPVHVGRVGPPAHEDHRVPSGGGSSCPAGETSALRGTCRGDARGSDDRQAALHLRALPRALGDADRDAPRVGHDGVAALQETGGHGLVEGLERDPLAALGEQGVAVDGAARDRIAGMVAAAERTFHVREQDWRMSARKLLFHILMHEIRHWAQIALAIRLAGLEPPGDHDLFFSQALR